MQDVIEKLLILQDRDRKILRVQTELANIEPEREALERRATGSQTVLDEAKLKSKQTESARKDLELEAEAKKQLIAKYSIQQFQTKKNEEYKALAHEIETCKAQIVELEDRQLELMERGDDAQKETLAAARVAGELKKHVESQIAELDAREQGLEKQLADLNADYEQLVGAVDEGVLNRYQRLRRHKGENTVVGIEHRVCGGCHMKLPTQIVVTCQGQQELVSCPNCGRILYYARHMDLAFID